LADSKYGINIITRPRDKDLEEWKEVGDTRKVNVYVDGDIVPGGHYLQGTWVYKASSTPYPEKTHSHDYSEYLGFVGSNPNDPLDLGGEVDLCIGDEVHTLTRTSMVFIPGGVNHCPIYFKRVDYPIWLFATAQMKTYEKEYLEKDEAEKK